MEELRDDLIGDGRGGALRAAMANFATGVCVVTAVEDDVAHAMTANSFTAISLDPPLVMISVRKVGRFHPVLMGAGEWAVSILSVGQEELARHFARSGRDLTSQFSGVDLTAAPHSGAPLMNGAMAWLDCSTTATIDAGDHTMVLGAVNAAHRAGGEAEPLLYFRGGFHRADPDDV